MFDLTENFKSHSTLNSSLPFPSNYHCVILLSTILRARTQQMRLSSSAGRKYYYIVYKQKKDEL